MIVLSENNLERHENNVLPLDKKSNLQAAKAWETFTGNGNTSSVSVRNIIHQSWIKSRDLGISPETERAPTVISKDEIDEKLGNEDLGRAGKSVLDELSDILLETEHVVVLADSQGQIFYSVGHRQIQNKLERINFRPGGAWSEQVVGPNGVGTPLTLGRPELVMGYEHYCQGWHPWVCYGAPIHDSNKQNILGTVDITGPVKKLNKEVLALAFSVSQSIQSGLSIIQFHRREVLREIGKEKVQRWPSEGVVILDESGFIVEYNARAIRYLKLDSASFLSTPIEKLFPCLSDSIKQSFKHQKQLELNIHMENQSGLLMPIQVRIEPVIKSGSCLGTVLVLTEKSQAPQSRGARSPEQYAPQSRYTFDNIQGTSEKIKNTINMARAAARDPLESNVLLIGETGTGKELLAHSIHSESARMNGPFIAINCAAIPRDLIESELFGYVAGAFTGASRDGRKGKFELAHSGTLFLDEINSMSLELQSKFLRVLDFMEVTPVGGADPILVNVRVIAAVNEKIYSAVEEGVFRLDLFHRLSVLEIPVPSLSDRGNDIIELANEILRTECKAAGKETLILSSEVVDLMKSYNWPGNIRELYNVCVRWVLTVTGSKVTYKDLPERISKFDILNKPITTENLRSISDELIKRTLIQTNNNVSKAARILGIDC